MTDTLTLLALALAGVGLGPPQDEMNWLRKLYFRVCGRRRIRRRLKQIEAM